MNSLRLMMVRRLGELVSCGGGITTERYKSVQNRLLRNRGIDPQTKASRKARRELTLDGVSELSDDDLLSLFERVVMCTYQQR